MTHFKLFSNCIITRGFNRGIISDIQRNKLFFIPNDLIEIVDYLSLKNSVSSLYEKFGLENKDTIEEYINFLVENELGFYLTEKEFDFFPEMKMDFHTPSRITNAIIEISEHNISFYKSILANLSALNCRYLQFVFYECNLLNRLEEMIEYSRLMNFKSVEILLNYEENIHHTLKDIINNTYNVTCIYLFNITENETNEFKKESIPIVSFDYKLNNFKSCGLINTKYFVVRKENFTESINHNSCLHKKITIDKEGNIKNCPAMESTFGNIKTTTFKETLDCIDFKKYWNVTKDKINICKDCEFRYICTDCRAYTERTHFEGQVDLSKPLKCGYNPYTNDWTEWSTSPLKQEAIEYYQMQELIKNV